MGDPAEAEKITEPEEKTDGSLALAWVTVVGCGLLLLSATAFAVYGLIAGRTMSLPGRGGSGGYYWYFRGTDPGEFWFTESLWLFLGGLGPALGGCVLWSIFRSKSRRAKEAAAPSGEQTGPRPQGPGGDGTA